MNPDSPITDQTKVLFFGRKNCSGTEKALETLNHLGFCVTSVISGGRGEALPEIARKWTGAYILCFRSLFILPKSVLQNASVAAINFHPAPPEYPGSGCINFALYDNAKEYGVTAHVMNTKVDNGTILRCERFPIEVSDTLDSLLKRTHQALLDLFVSFVQRLAQDNEAFLRECEADSTSETWRGEARTMKELEALQTLSCDITQTELERIVRATYTDAFPPKLFLHGYKFSLSSPNKLK